MYTHRSDLDVYVDVKGHFCRAGVLSAYRNDDAGTDLLRIAAATCAADHGAAGYADRTVSDAIARGGEPHDTGICPACTESEGCAYTHAAAGSGVSLYLVCAIRSPAQSAGNPMGRSDSSGQMEVSHSMENVIYNELRMRGFSVNVGNLTVVENEKTGKTVKKQLEVDFICNKGSRKYYIQSAYMLGTAEKMEQEIRPFLKINDSFKKIVITSDTPKPFYNDEGILMMNVYDFLLNANSLEL